MRLGLNLSPVPLKLRGRDIELVGLGSYLINTAGCGECHTHPAFLPGSNPFLGQAEVINAEQYMAGFEAAIRTGRKRDGSSRIMQVMPWPQMGKRTTRELRAM